MSASLFQALRFKSYESRSLLDVGAEIDIFNGGTEFLRKYA
jgi:hypothetical protein